MNLSNLNVLQHVRTNPDLVFVRTLDFSVELRSLIESINDKSVEWTISGAKGNTTAFFNGLHKIYPCYDNGQWKLDLAETVFEYCVSEFKRLDPTAIIKSPTRAILNLTRSDGIMSEASVHQDNTSLTHWSFLVYLKGTSGDTDFNQSMTTQTVISSIEFNPCHVVMFPSVYAHQGHLPVDNNDRFVLNYIVEIESDLNNRILDKSPSILKKQLGVKYDH